jgi:Deoxycytidine deaminase
MSVLSDKWIKKMVKNHKMIRPFVSKQVRKRKISYGLSSYGYDARVSDDFKSLPM